MSTALQASSESSGPAAYLPSEEKDSSILADLTAMFPSMDYEVLVSVLQGHGGCIEEAVEYLMATDMQEMDGSRNPLYYTGDPASDMMGKFSDDIGGLPEVLPRYACEGEIEEDSSDDNNNSCEDEGLGPSGEYLYSPLGSHGPVDPDGDPLPTYAEASAGRDAVVSPEVSPDELEAESEALTPVRSSIEGEGKTTITLDSENSKKKRGKKLHIKLASKLNPRKKGVAKGVAKYKAVQEKLVNDGLDSDCPQLYQPLIQDNTDDEESS